MASIKDIKMKPKLIGAFLIASIVPLVIIALLSINKTEDAMMKQAFNQLNSVEKI